MYIIILIILLLLSILYCFKNKIIKEQFISDRYPSDYNSRMKGCLFGYTRNGNNCIAPSKRNKCSYNYKSLKKYSVNSFNNWVYILRKRGCPNTGMQCSNVKKAAILYTHPNYLGYKIEIENNDKNMPSHCPDFNQNPDILWEFEKKYRYCGEKDKFSTGKYNGSKSNLKSFKLGCGNQITFWSGTGFSKIPNDYAKDGSKVNLPITYRKSMHSFHESDVPIAYVVCKKRNGHCKKPEY